MKFLIVGAGFAGGVYARELAEAGHTVDVIDSRDHIAGNAYDYVNEDGIRVHKYGPHIFHTSNMKVVDWLSKFTDWVEHEHKVLAKHTDGDFYVLPPNRDTVARIGKENIIDVFFRPYTKKMWEKEIEELNPKILERVPIRDDDNELYFPNDDFQKMPVDGYTALFERIFDHENITVKLDCLFDKSMENEYDHVFNSMPIDQYYDYEFGELPYRSIKFKTVTLPERQMYKAATTNFTTYDGPTRVTEWKNFPNHGVNHLATTLTYEYPCDYKDNNMERYYPVKDIEGINASIYEKYLTKDNSKVSFIGRCGTYQYLDMHQVINQSLISVKKFLDN
jgi:UDP-galactopyranose mutase